MRLFLYLFNILNVINFSGNFQQQEVIKENKIVDNIVSISEVSYVGVSDENSYLYYQDSKYFLERVVSKGIETVNNIYLVCNCKEYVEIIIFNKFNKNLSIKTFENVFIENIYDINNSLYIVGSIFNNGLIYRLSYDLDLIDKRVFYSDGVIQVNHLLYCNDKFYISIYKDGITNNSEFINHGNNLEKKSIIVQLDLEYKIINTYYINEFCFDEIVINLCNTDDGIKLLLKTNKNYYIYNLSFELDNLKYYVINSQDDLELIIHHKSINEDLVINKSTNMLSLTSNNKIDDIYKISNLKILYDYKIIDSSLYLYGLEDVISIYKLSEYEILKKEAKVLNYFNVDYLDTSNIIVESFFGNIDITIDSISPYFDKTMSGTYEIRYNVIQENNELLKLELPLIVEEYTNFHNYGIYNINKTLEFFGTAKLNGEPIYYGMCINEVGEYDIEIININGEKKIYHIYIVEDYYKDEKIINTNAIDVINDSAIIVLNIGDLIVKEVIINDHIYENYHVDNNTLVIEFNKSDQHVESYIFNRIVFFNDEQEFFYDINKQLTFNYSKIPPNIVLNKTLESNLLKIDCDVIDLDKTFVYLKVVHNNEETIISNNKKMNLKDFKLYYVYDLGNGIKQQILICEVNQDKLFNLDIICKYDSGSLQNIEININLDNNHLNMLNVNDTSIIDFYKKINNSNYLKNIIFISLVIFSVVGIIFIVYIGIKKRKQKVF